MQKRLLSLYLYLFFFYFSSNHNLLDRQQLQLIKQYSIKMKGHTLNGIDGTDMKVHVHQHLYPLSACTVCLISLMSQINKMSQNGQFELLGNQWEEGVPLRGSLFQILYLLLLKAILYPHLANSTTCTAIMPPIFLSTIYTLF